MPKIPFLGCAIFSFFLTAGNPDGEQRVSVKASYNTSSVPEVLNTVAVGFTFVFADGETESTGGWMGGRVSWRSLRIFSPQGKVEDGLLTFDRQKVWNNGHSVRFTIGFRGTSLACNLALPYVRHIRFNLYTDSIKRNIPFYLNVEGRFSSGRIYPLDTGMIAFSASGGSLAGSVLEVTKAETAIHQVKVSAWLKTDPAMRATVSIPVKIMPDTATLPTAVQLQRKWKQERDARRQVP